MHAADILDFGLIIGSTRPHRFADRPARWLLDAAAARGDLRLTVLDLRDAALPLYGEPPATPDTLARWSDAVAGRDGYVILAAEYNHAPTAALKNALDSAPPHDWHRKPVGFVGYGGVGGARAVEHLRLIAVELQMVPVRAAVHIGGETFLAAARDGRDLASFPHLATARDAMLDQLVWWGRVLKAARRETRVAA